MLRHFTLPAIACVTAVSAWAANPHFIFANGSIDNDGALVVNFKEAGLGNSTERSYLLTASATAIYQCFNNGNQRPHGQPFQVTDQNLTATGDYSSGLNGQVTASLEAGPPAASPTEAAQKCLSGGNRKLCLREVTYTSAILEGGYTVPEGQIQTYDDRTDVNIRENTLQFPTPTRQNPNPDNCQSSL